MAEAQDQQINAEELIKLLAFDVNRIYAQLDSGATLDHHFEISPEDFLAFAESDLAAASRQGLINALSNAKRAIDSQVDKVLSCFGLNSRHNFPKKMETLREMGIVAPRIVNKVVRARNYLEHEYKCPDLEQVEDAIDIATLFVGSLDRALHFFPEQFEFGSLLDQNVDSVLRVNADRMILVTFQSDSKQFILEGYEGSGVLKGTDIGSMYEAKRVGRASILVRNKGYVELIKLASSVERDRYSEQAVLNFLRVFEN